MASILSLISRPSSRAAAASLVGRQTEAVGFGRFLPLRSTGTIVLASSPSPTIADQFSGQIKLPPLALSLSTVRIFDDDKSEDEAVQSPQPQQQDHPHDAKKKNDKQEELKWIWQRIVHINDNDEEDAILNGPRRKWFKEKRLLAPESQNSWMEKYKKLEEYQRVHGDCRVAKDDPENEALRLWMRDQRLRHRQALARNANYLDEDKTLRERHRLLNDLGFSWAWQRSSQRSSMIWSSGYEQLKQFQKKHGHCNVPGSSSYKELAQWVESQKWQYWKYHSNSTAPAALQKQHSLLNGLGFNWQPRSFVLRYKELQDFHQEHGHCLVPFSCDNKPLRHWVVWLRRAHQKLLAKNENYLQCNTPLSKMRLQQHKLLNELGFAWKPDKWMVRFGEMKEFHKKHGHCRPVDNKVLNKWSHRQRDMHRLRLAQDSQYLYRKTPMAEMLLRRYQLLSGLGFGWNQQENWWMERYNQLKEFHKQHGHCLVPRLYPDNKALGLWVSHQRVEYRKRFVQKNSKGSLDDDDTGGVWQERFQLLDELGFVWQLRARRRNWMERFQELKEYHAQHGNCSVPSDYKASPHLSDWISQQRRILRDAKSRKPETLSRIALLNQLNFDWDRDGRVPTKQSTPARAGKAEL